MNYIHLVTITKSRSSKLKDWENYLQFYGAISVFEYFWSSYRCITVPINFRSGISRNYRGSVAVEWKLQSRSRERFGWMGRYFKRKRIHSVAVSFPVATAKIRIAGHVSYWLANDELVFRVCALEKTVTRREIEIGRERECVRERKTGPTREKRRGWEGRRRSRFDPRMIIRRQVISGFWYRGRVMGKTVTLLSYPLWIHWIRPGRGRPRLFVFIRITPCAHPSCVHERTCNQVSTLYVQLGGNCSSEG